MKAHSSPKAPKAVGPYSQAMRTGNLLFCSGQTPINPATMRIEETTVAQQTKTAIENLRIVLDAAGLNLQSIVKTNVYLADMELFQEMNAAYSECFGDHRPARTTVAVKGLPLNALVEIECVAEFIEENH